MKRFFYWASLLLLPVIIVALLEGIIRFVGFGERYHLFNEQEGELQINMNYPGKYFSSKQVAVPQLIEQKISGSKSQNTIRIVCLGGSTTAGFPFEVNINFPYFIRRYLEMTKPNKTIEIINLGISAINSHALLDMCPEIAKIKPDFVIIYMGHNEFYGAMGLASNEMLGKNRWLIRLILTLRNYHLYQLLQAGTEELSSLINSSAVSGRDATLMNAMIGKDQIQCDDIIRQKTYANFKANLKDILIFWKGKKIPVLISDVVCNLKDQLPLGQPVSFEWGEGDKQLVKRFTDHYALKDWLACIEPLRVLLEKDSCNALLHFYLANCYYQTQHYKEAHKHYILARDFDSMPFRAPTAINQLIKQIARECDAHFVSAESTFSAAAPNGIMDNTLFLEHVHPNPKGYELLAQVFLNSLIELMGQQAIDKSTFNGVRDYTDLDVIIGELKIRDLIKHPPFKESTRFNPTKIEDPQILEIAMAHVYKNLYWDGAHLQLGQYYLDQGRLGKALGEYRAIINYENRHVPALVKMGDVMFLSQHWAQAEEYYQRALHFSTNRDYIKAKLGKLYIVSEQNKEGITILSNLLYTTPLKTTEVIANKAELHYLLAIGLARSNEFDEAKKELDAALLLNKDYQPALELLEQFNRLK